jgi:hypothetical protein
VGVNNLPNLREANGPKVRYKDRRAVNIKNVAFCEIMTNALLHMN